MIPALFIVAAMALLFTIKNAKRPERKTETKPRYRGYLHE